MMTRVLACALALLLSTAASFGQQSPQPTNASFELASEVANEIPGWFVPPMVRNAGITIESIYSPADAVVGDGLVTMQIPARATTPANMLQAVDATPYRGKRIKLSAYMRAFDRGDDASQAARAQLWIRVDRENQQLGFFDNMADRAVTDNGLWQTATIEGDIHPDALAIYIGVLGYGHAEILVDGVRIEILGDAAADAFAQTGPVQFDNVVGQPAAPLGDRGVRNLTALARATAYARWFHPSNASAETDWDRWIVARVPAYEAIEDDTTLVETLRADLGPIAPGAAFWMGRKTDSGSVWRERMTTEEWATLATDAERAIHWRHEGLYESERVTLEVDQTPEPDGRFRMPLDAWLPAGFEAERELVPGVRMRWPVRLAADDEGSLPRGETSETVNTEDADDRAVRLAGVMVAWATLDQFYPYFDTIDTDWSTTLAPALRDAAEDRSVEDWVQSVRRLVSKLHDGHGNVYHRASVPTHVLPFGAAWVGEELIVVRPDRAGELSRGDRVVSLDNRAVNELYREIADTISGSEQWTRYLSAVQLGASYEASPVTLRVERADGSVDTVVVDRVARGQEPEPEARPVNYSEVAPGIRYVDLANTTMLDLVGRMPTLSQARGVVMDLRGYPSELGPAFLQHLTGVPAHSPIWQVPVLQLPDRSQREFVFSRWLLTPEAPRLPERVAFLVDGRTISYAESLASTIEKNGLGILVGSPTAGANGNVVPVELPGGATMTFTGMRVATHDGGQHHITGVIPDFPVSPTREGIAAGKDEVLDEAVRILQIRER